MNIPERKPLIIDEKFIKENNEKTNKFILALQKAQEETKKHSIKFG